ncbi:MAG: SpoIVB peptidase, partial [Clostridia bacterium]|nr:SpoIVB peptidase [Clostridia bacterium]
MGKKITAAAAGLLWALILLCVLGAGVLDIALPKEISLLGTEELPSYPCVSFGTVEEEVTGFGSVATVKAKLFGVVSLKKIEVKKYENISLIPGGMSFGVRLLGEGVCIVGLSEVAVGEKNISPAASAGLSPKDLIIEVDGAKVRTVQDFKRSIASSEGKTLSLLCKRNGKTFSTTLTPAKDNTGQYTAGMWVRDSASGIGTVTFIDPKTGAFGALGHGICDSSSGELLPLSRGIVTDAVVTGIEKGKKGAPGELKGYLKSEKKGVLEKNTGCGVFGYLIDVPQVETVPIALSSKVHTGKATIRCTLDNGVMGEYEIEITEIHGQSENKSFTLKVTDERLLEQTGGIVQGMSGSPIIQNGKLIGAVTHVMVNDPTRGYG